MAHTHAVSKCIYPKVFNLERFCHVECGQGMVNTLPEVQISLILRIRYHLKLVLRTVVWSIYIDPTFERCQSRAQRSTSQWSVVEPSKKVSCGDVVIEDIFKACTMRSGDIEFLDRFLRVAAWTIGQDTLRCGMD